MNAHERACQAANWHLTLINVIIKGGQHVQVPVLRVPVSGTIHAWIR